MMIVLPSSVHNTTGVSMFCRGCGEETLTSDFCSDACWAEYKGIELEEDETEQEEWNTEELKRDFEVLGFQAPFVVVRRRSDGQLGSLEFRHEPRVYWGWTPHEQGEFRYVVTVTCESQKEADQVMVERLGPDEDYGFFYRVDWTKE